MAEEVVLQATEVMALLKAVEEVAVDMMAEAVKMVAEIMAVAVVVTALPTMEAAVTVHPAAAAREQAAFVFCSTLSTLNKGVITYENIPDCR